MAKVRFKDPKWAKFSSYMGTTKFENGMSVDDVSPAEIRLLGAITSIVVVEEDGAERNGGLGQEHVDARSRPMPVVPEPKRDADKPASPEEITPAPAVITNGKPEKPVEGVEKAAEDLEKEMSEAEAQVEEPAAPTKVWTREELDTLADDKGIRGLRVEAGDPLGVKDNSIEGLIEEILAAQARVKQ